MLLFKNNALKPEENTIKEINASAEEEITVKIFSIRPPKSPFWSYIIDPNHSKISSCRRKKEFIE